MVQLNEIVERRRVLRRRLSLSAIVTIVAGLAASSPTFVSAVLPIPDPTRVLFTELAQTHYRATSTSTVVKEYSDLRGLFVAEYTTRNAHRGQSPVDLPAPRGLWSYSYVPGGNDIREHGFDELFTAAERPSMVVTEPSDPPFVVWIYSKEQNAVAVFFFERLIHDVFEGKPPSPDPRMFLDYDSAGTIAAFGPTPTERLIYTHAWLLSLGDVDARGLVYGETRPRAEVLDFIPFVVEVSAREEFIPPVFSGTPLDRARDEVRRPARALRLVLLFVAVVAAIAAAWVMFSLVRMRMAFYGVAEVGIGSFLFGNLEAIATRENEKSRATAAAIATMKREEEERGRLQAEISALAEPPSEELSIAELREHRDLLVAEAAARAEEEFRAQAADHERQRDIHRLEVELAVIPVEAASDEDHVARRSWGLLQRALSASEPRERLGLLKEARRLLPREFRPERF